MARLTKATPILPEIEVPTTTSTCPIPNQGGTADGHCTSFLPSVGLPSRTCCVLAAIDGFLPNAGRSDKAPPSGVSSAVQPSCHSDLDAGRLFAHRPRTTAGFTSLSRQP